MNTCCICLNEDENLILYNHCGTYYVHNKCLNECINNYQNQCFICREYIIDISSENNDNNIIEAQESYSYIYILRCSLLLFFSPLLLYILDKLGYCKI